MKLVSIIFLVLCSTFLNGKAQNVTSETAYADIFKEWSTQVFV